MFVIWGLHGEGRCHGGVVTAFFVDTSGESPTCADKRTERVGLGRSRTRPNPTAQLSLGGWLRTCPRFFSSSSAKRGRSIGAGGHLAGSSQFPVSAPLSGASLNGFGEKTLGQAERAPLGDSDSQGRAEVHSLGFFLGLDRHRTGSHSLPIANRCNGATNQSSRRKASRKARHAVAPAGGSFLFHLAKRTQGSGRVMLQGPGRLKRR